MTTNINLFTDQPHFERRYIQRTNFSTKSVIKPTNAPGQDWKLWITNFKNKEKSEKENIIKSCGLRSVNTQP